MATANLDYAEEYGDGTVELQPTSLPLECNFPDGSSSYENVANVRQIIYVLIDNQFTFFQVRFLFQHGIINWPNFTHCMPNCGLCTQFASDQTYLIVCNCFNPYPNSFLVQNLEQNQIQLYA
jgi:hypothetical protein